MATVLTPPPAVRGLSRRVFSDTELATIRQHPRFAAGLPARLTAADFQVVWGLVLQDQKTHLIRGVIYVEPFMNPSHAAGVRLVAIALEAVFAVGHDVRCQLPVDLDLYSLPLPDVAVVPGSPRDYLTAHPTAFNLIVDVADSTLFDDTTTKAELYAEAGVANYWVLDVLNRQLIVFRDPAPLPAALGGVAYRTKLTLAAADTVSPLAAPQASIAVADLLP